MMADELAAEAVVHQPGVAVGAGKPEAAGAAQRQRRVAAAIEEQQCLLLALQRDLHRLGEARRHKAPARRAFAGEIDRLDGGQVRTAEPLRQMQPPITPAPRIHLGLDRGRRRRQHHGDFGDVGAHHRHVAGVIVHAVLLLVRGVVLFIDDDEAEVCIGKEQRRARTGDYADFATRDRMPGAGAPPRAQLRMPFRRPHPETRCESIEKLPRERNLRHQDQALPTARNCFGDGLEIDLGLARAGDAIEQGHGKAAVHAIAQCCAGFGLCGREIRHRVGGIGWARDRRCRQFQNFECTFIDQTVDHAGRYAGLVGGVALAVGEAVGKQAQHPAAGRRHAFRGRAGKPDADAQALGAQMLAHPQRHARHHAARA